MKRTDFTKVAPSGARVISSKKLTKQAIKPFIKEHGDRIGFAELAGISVPSVTTYLNGNRTPNHPALIKVAEGLDYCGYKAGCAYIEKLFAVTSGEKPENKNPSVFFQSFAKAWDSLGWAQAEEIDLLVGKDTRHYWVNRTQRPTLDTLRYAYWALLSQDVAIADTFLAEVLARPVKAVRA